MNDNKTYSNLQLYSLVVLRFLIGWHFLFEGISKLFDPHWSSAGFLSESQWILTGFARWVTTSDSLLSIVDFLNTWGLIAIGTGLILGFLSRAASVFGTLLLLLYYLNAPPFPGLEYSMPFEGNYLVINKTLIEAAAMFVLALFPTSHIIGFDLFLKRGEIQANKKTEVKENDK
jgi:thiosulfate dehydrogenase (quinone) large subunit